MTFSVDAILCDLLSADEAGVFCVRNVTRCSFNTRVPVGAAAISVACMVVLSARGRTMLTPY